MRKTTTRLDARKTISGTRDRIQSEILTGCLGALLVSKAAAVTWAIHRIGTLPPWFWIAVGASVAFAAIVRALRAATTPAAMLGGFVCLNILLGQALGLAWQETQMPALLTLFVLTFAATRFGRRRKQQLGTAEPKSGRRAAQIVANLGIAGLCGGASHSLLVAACLAALAEATADTVSSEMGQVFGGRTLLITTWSEVPAGTDGGISIAGTTLGAAAAGAVVLVTATTRLVTLEMGLVVFAAAVGGLLFDSYLGATVERRGWLGNDAVNTASTLFAAVAAFVAMRFV